MRNSLTTGAERRNPAAYEKLRTPVRYVRGTYDDPRTYVAPRTAFGGARRPVRYLAIPRELYPSAPLRHGSGALALRVTACRVRVDDRAAEGTLNVQQVGLLDKPDLDPNRDP